VSLRPRWPGQWPTPNTNATDQFTADSISIQGATSGVQGGLKSGPQHRPSRATIGAADHGPYETGPGSWWESQAARRLLKSPPAPPHHHKAVIREPAVPGGCRLERSDDPGPVVVSPPKEQPPATRPPWATSSPGQLEPPVPWPTGEWPPVFVGEQGQAPAPARSRQRVPLKGEGIELVTADSKQGRRTTASIGGQVRVHSRQRSPRGFKPEETQSL